MPLIESSIPSSLERLAQQRPDDVAFTFIDYEVDPAGFAETLTWSQVHQRAGVIAEELLRCGSVGDPVAIGAPQGLDYIVGFLGALEAGRIAVPLPVPEFGAHDERASGALRDSSPVALLTTSAAVNDVVPCVRALPGFVPAVIEIDALDLDAPLKVQPTSPAWCETALLQYTSGSTRDPAAVMISHKNIFANCRQVTADYLRTRGGTPAGSHAGVVAAVLSRYGTANGVTGGVTFGVPAVLMSPMAFLQKPARYMQKLASNTHAFSAVPNFAFELAARRTSDADMAGLDLGNVHTILSGSERVHAATIRRFTERFSRFNFPAGALKPSYGLAEAMVYAGSSSPGRPPVTVWFDYEKLSAGHARPCESETACVSSASALRAPAPCGSSIPRPGWRIRPVRSGRSGCMATMLRVATGASRNCRSGPSVDSSSIHHRERRWSAGFGQAIWVSSMTASSSSSVGSRIC